MTRPPWSLVRVAAFVNAFASEPYCANCLAEKIGIEIYRVREAIAALASESGFTVERRRCTACGRSVKTLTSQGVTRAICRLCGRPIGRDDNLVFPQEGGVVHHACFVSESKK